MQLGRFMQLGRVHFCIIRGWKFGNPFRRNHFRVLPYCFLQPKRRFRRFFAQFSPFVQRRVSLYS